MSAERIRLVEALFIEASELPACDQERFVSLACLDDPAAAAEVMSLLAFDHPDDAFLRSPVLRPEREGSADGDASLARVDVPSRIGGYRILRLIGEGGMGAVYEAEQDRPRRVVALKALRRGIASPSALRRLEFEAAVLARLTHPGIAQLYEVGDEDGVPYFAMQYIADAEPITAYARRARLNRSERLAIFAQICDAVRYAHQRGVIHRDLKPSNILVDAAGQPRIIDFGVARCTDADVAMTTMQTSVGQLIGTLQYMSPEQCLADPHDLDLRCDVYSLGVILYELLTDRTPYDLTDLRVFEATRLIREQPPARPNTVNRVLRGDLETILLKALEKDRTHRYQSAADLGADVRRFLAGEPIVARPPSVTYLLRTLARRHRGRVVAGAAILLALIFGLVGTTIGLARARASNAEAVQEATNARDVSEFLAQMLVSGDPMASLYSPLMPAVRPRDAKVLDLVADVARLIDQEFEDRPAIQAVLHDAVGNVYDGFGQWNLACLHLHAALDARGRAGVPPDGAVVKTMLRLTDSLLRMGRLDEAMTLSLETIALSTRVNGPHHADTMLARLQPTTCLSTYLRRHEAIQIVRPLLDDAIAHLGDHHPVTIAIQLRLAVMLGYVGERVEAQRLARIALDSAETALGMDHVATMWVRFHVSELEFWSDRTSGERSIAGGIESAILHLGERHPVVLHQRFTLAESIGKAGRPDAAIGIATQALDDLEAEGLGDSFPALDAHAVLAFLHEQAGDVNEAIDHVQRAIGHNARCRGADNPKIVILRADLGRLLLKAGDTAAAKRTLLALSDELRSWHNSYDPRDWKPLVLSAMSSCAMAMKDAGPEALAEAEALAIQAAAELDRLYGPTDRETLDARHTLAAVLATRGQAVRAAAELESLLEAADSHLPADDAELAGYRVLYAHVLQDLGRSEDAAVQLEAARTAMEATGERSELRLAWQLERARLDAAGDPG